MSRGATLFFILFYLFKFFAFYHKIQIMIKQEIYTKATERGEEAQKEIMGLIDSGLPESKN